ncbi:MAG: hypothetical protein NTW94_08635 [Legionellales bacterium]|nr:hypothetical protein [Legionellales bacterium]
MKEHDIEHDLPASDVPVPSEKSIQTTKLERRRRIEDLSDEKRLREELNEY